MKDLPYIIAIDPSMRACGLAWLQPKKGAIIEAETIKTRLPKHTDAILNIYNKIAGEIGEYPTSDVFILEQPVLLESWTENKKQSVAKLLQAFGAYLMLARCAFEIWTPTAQEWKGQTPKTISHARALKTLDRAKISYDVDELDHNAKDAIALIATYLQRKGYIK
jgi:Holliday junction resolvasome RuvABC endonuclease subunit